MNTGIITLKKTNRPVRSKSVKPEKEAEVIKKKKITVFLDRDGVINKRRRILVKSWNAFEFLPGVLESLKKLKNNGYRIIVVTNQDVVGWNFISESKLNEIHEKMRAAVEDAGGEISDIFYCPHNPMRKCDCRKPKPGMLLEAAEKYKISPADSWMVGDKLSDMAAGKAFGSKTILVKAGKRTPLESDSSGDSSKQADFVVYSLEDAVGVILRENGASN